MTSSCHVMVATRKDAPGTSSSTIKYSVLLPTYNERDNIALIVWLLIKTFTEWCASIFDACMLIING